jgi:hypothetical protein
LSVVDIALMPLAYPVAWVLKDFKMADRDKRQSLHL